MQGGGLGEVTRASTNRVRQAERERDEAEEGRRHGGAAGALCGWREPSRAYEERVHELCGQVTAHEVLEEDGHGVLIERVDFHHKDAESGVALG